MAIKPCKDCVMQTAYGSTRCERCQEIYNKKRKEYLREYGKKWRAAHPNYMKEYNK